MPRAHPTMSSGNSNKSQIYESNSKNGLPQTIDIKMGQTFNQELSFSIENSLTKNEMPTMFGKNFIKNDSLMRSTSLPPEGHVKVRDR